MSSAYIRQQVFDFLALNAPSETVIDLTLQYAEIPTLVEDAGLTPDDPWTGVEFVGNDERPITIGSNNAQGKYRETGAIIIHVIGLAVFGGAGSILSRAETLRNLFRGQRLGTMFIESMTPVNTEAGAALRFEDGYMTASFILSYENDIDL